MNKKRETGKVLIPLPAGFTVKQITKWNEKEKKVDSSYITIFQGKRQLPDLKFKNPDEALKYFEGNLNK